MVPPLLISAECNWPPKLSVMYTKLICTHDCDHKHELSDLLSSILRWMSYYPKTPYSTSTVAERFQRWVIWISPKDDTIIHCSQLKRLPVQVYKLSLSCFQFCWLFPSWIVALLGVYVLFESHDMMVRIWPADRRLLGVKLPPALQALCSLCHPK